MNAKNMKMPLLITLNISLFLIFVAIVIVNEPKNTEPAVSAKIVYAIVRGDNCISLKISGIPLITIRPALTNPIIIIVTRLPIM